MDGKAHMDFTRDIHMMASLGALLRSYPLEALLVVATPWDQILSCFCLGTPNMRHHLERCHTEPAPVDTTHDGSNGSIHGVSSGSLTQGTHLGLTQTATPRGRTRAQTSCLDLLGGSRTLCVVNQLPADTALELVLSEWASP